MARGRLSYKKVIKPARKKSSFETGRAWYKKIARKDIPLIESNWGKYNLFGKAGVDLILNCIDQFDIRQVDATWWM